MVVEIVRAADPSCRRGAAVLGVAGMCELMPAVARRSEEARSRAADAEKRAAKEEELRKDFEELRMASGPRGTKNRVTRKFKILIFRLI